MEKIQERALKCIYNENHSTYEELLAKSKLPSLTIRGSVGSACVAHLSFCFEET